MSKHTPEPWYIHPEPWSPSIRTGKNGYEIARAKSPYMHQSYREEERANGDRIVACVNACAGMKDPADEIERLRARVAELEADNADFKKLIADELAETLRLFGAIGLNEADDFGTKTAIEAVRDRIESIKADRDHWKAEAMAARGRLTKQGYELITVGPTTLDHPRLVAYSVARAANKESDHE